MSKEPVPVSTQRHAVHSRAKALAVILANEFGVPFNFFDANDGRPVSAHEPDGRAAPRRDYESGFVRQIAEEGHCRAHRLDDGHNLLTLVLTDAERPVLVAFGVLRSLAGAGPDRPQELSQLQKWLQTFSDRLRLNDLYAGARRAAEDQSAQLKRAWEMILGLDEAVRHVRIYRDPEKNRQVILKAARAFLDVESVLWVPSGPGVAPQYDGHPCFALADCRPLAELLARQSGAGGRKPVLWNADAAPLWAHRFPQIRNLLAFVVTDQGETGWLVALNKQAPAAERAATAAACPFRRSDAALLAPFAALFELQQRGSRRYQELKGLLVGLTRSLTSALDAKDAYTFGHSERVARIAVELGQEMGLQEDELSDIYLAGLLHDIGKIGIPDALLTKPGALEPHEMERLQQHVTIGYHILADLQPLRNLLPGVLYHHERMDGKGYPDGLAGEQIPVLARILAVADAFDAMSTKRAYRDALQPARVDGILREGAGAQWDARVVEAFFRCRERIHLIRQRGVGQSLCQALDMALRAKGSSHFTQLRAARAVAE